MTTEQPLDPTFRETVTNYPRTLAEMLTEAAQLATWLADVRSISVEATLGDLENRRQQLAELLDAIRVITKSEKA